jgi:Fe-S cluster assembly protein SufD
VLNDTFYPVNSTAKQHLPEGVIIESLRTAADNYPQLVEKYLGKLSNEKNDGWIAFNETFAQDGFFMYVPKNVKLSKPVQLINIMRSDVDFMANSHNLIILEEGAKAQLLVCDHTMDNVHFFSNRLTEVFAGKNAVYEHYKLENTNILNTNVSNLLIHQEDSSNILTNVITLHNGMTRNGIEMIIDGENCESLLCGMVIGDKNQDVDNFTEIVHKKPNSQSRELFKYVLDDSSKGAFAGKIQLSNQQKYSPQQNCQNANQTATRNLCRRCEMFAWRYHRTIGRSSQVLHAIAWHFGERSTFAANVCLYCGCDGQYPYQCFERQNEIIGRKTPSR